MSRTASVSLHEPLLPNERNLGKDRRQFVILSVFDCTLTVLLWLIWTVSKMDDWRIAFYQEIDIFNKDFLKISLFDIVVVAVLRLFLLISLYGFFRVKSWVPVAVSTTITSIYVIIKVLFFFSSKQGGIPQYLLILTSFTISWLELWLMPFRVLPRERDRERLSNEDSLESPHSYHGNSSHSARQAHGRSRHPINFTTSADEFHSAIDFSSDEDHITQACPIAVVPITRRLSLTTITTERKVAFETCMTGCITLVEQLIGDARFGKWKTLRKANPLVCQSTEAVFYVCAYFENTLRQDVFNASWKNTTAWNDQVLETKTVLNVDANTELFYSVSAPAMRGYIASRDFIDIRRVVVDEDRKIISGYFTSYEDPPVQIVHPDRSVIRGANGPSMIRVSSEDNGCVFEWVMQCDLRGGLPKRIVQSNMVSFFVTYIDKLRKYVANPDTALPTIQE